MINLSKNSWHYRLADCYSTIKLIETDLCSYMKCVMMGLLIASGIAVVVSAFLSLFMLFGIYMYVGYTIGFVDTPPIVVVFGGVTTFVVTTFYTLLLLKMALRPVFRKIHSILERACSAAFEYHEKRREAKPANDSFIREVLRSIKEKTCIQINWN